MLIKDYLYILYNNGTGAFKIHTFINWPVYKIGRYIKLRITDNE